VTGLGNEAALTRFNPKTGAEEAKIPLPSPSSGVTAAFGSVWVTRTAGNELYRIDPETDQISATISVNSQPRFLASGEGSIWVLNQGDGTVQRVDGQSGEILATIEANAAGEGGDITVGGGSVWVTTMMVPVIRIDPETNSFAGKFKRPSGVYLGDAIRYGAGSLWISGNSIFRITPPE
jgi:streptogramin lyase